LQRYVTVGIRVYPCFQDYEEVFINNPPDSDITFRRTRYELFTPYWDSAKIYWDRWDEYYCDAGFPVPPSVDVTINAQSHYIFIDNT
jgi:hypothetical protein